MSVVFAGGGLKMGQVIGTTDAKAEYPRRAAVHRQDVLATMYHVLGIDHRHDFYDAGAAAAADPQRGQADRRS